MTARPSVVVYYGDSREVLKGIPDASVDAVVTDPPYGLSEKTPDAALVARVLTAWLAGQEVEVGGAGFMGKAWDAFVPGPAVWRECFRVLKPGGHLVAFFGTRTYDLGALAVRLAGFEVRDMLAWLYGTGFPKSFDVAKGIDALDAKAMRRQRALWFTAWIRATGLTAAKINEITGTAMGSHYTTDAAQPEVAVAEVFDQLRPWLGPVPAWVEELVAERTVESANTKARKVVGQHADVAQAAKWRANYDGGTTAPAGLITEAHTEAAKAWDGWGTALKPGLEPVVLARKPLEGTVAENVLKHGTGGLNIDACRVAMSDADREVINAATWRNSESPIYGDFASDGGDKKMNAHAAGRWPANVVHDGSDEVMGAFPDRDGMAVGRLNRGATTGSGIGFGSNSNGQDAGVIGYGDEGSAARFFYSAKADASDRMGSDHPTVKPADLKAWLVRLLTPPGGVVLDPFAGTGSTGVAARRAGFSAILIEREAKHFEDIKLRLAYDAGTAAHSLSLKARNRKPKVGAGDLFDPEGLGGGAA